MVESEVRWTSGWRVVGVFTFPVKSKASGDALGRRAGR